MRNLNHRTLEEEWMDAPDLDQAIYAQVLKDLAIVNRLTLAKRPTIAFLNAIIGQNRAIRVLDVGYGDGDMLRHIAAWAKRRGIAAELVGIDLNPNSARIAAAHSPADLQIDWRTGDYADCAGQDFDVILSSLVAHHMTEDQLIRFIRFMDKEAAMGWFVNDLHRHRIATIGFPILATIMRWHKIVRHDGSLSIARSYRPAEWGPILTKAGIAPGTARIFRAFPFRLCVASR